MQCLYFASPLKVWRGNIRRTAQTRETSFGAVGLLSV